MNTFVQRHRDSVIGVLNGFDRVRIRGTLRWLCYPDGLAKHLSKMRVLLKDFKGYAQRFTDRLREGIEAVAQAAGRPIEYLASPAISKEDRAREIAQRDGIREGLICVLSAVEPCRSFAVRGNRATRELELRSALRKCLHYYTYWLDPEWGFYHARVQTWLPLTIHVCLNGREWLARQMDRAELGYVRRDNCFVWIEDVAAAQRLMDRQLQVDWQRRLNTRLRRFHPAHAELFPTCPVGYYWSVDESEWASDVMFRSPAALARLYPRLIQHGMSHLGSREVLRFLGRQVPVHGGVPARFAGEVVSDLRKAVVDVPRRAQVCQAANERYLESLAAVNESSTTLAMLTGRVCRPTRWKGRRVRALNPLAPEDARLLAAVNRGEFAINGFRNRDLRPLLYADGDADPITRRRHAAAVTRKLRFLRAHGLIRKVPKTHRYTLSKKGTEVITALLAAQTADTTKLMAAA